MNDMGNMMNRNAQNTGRPFDVEDWWGDFDVNTPPPPQRAAKAYPARKKGMSAMSQAMMLLTCAVFLFCVCFQIYRMSVISTQNRQIEELRHQIDELSSEKQNLEVRLSLLENFDRIEDEAINRLGMVYPGEEQVRVIQIARTNDNIVTANAAAEEGGQENIAP